MIFLQVASYVSLTLAVSSLVYTAIQIHHLIVIRKLQEELVSKILARLEQNMSEDQIVSELLDDEWGEEDIRMKIKDIKELI